MPLVFTDTARTVPHFCKRCLALRRITARLPVLEWHVVLIDADRNSLRPYLPSHPTLATCVPTQSEICGGFNSFELFKLPPVCSGAPVEAYDQVRWVI